MHMLTVYDNCIIVDSVCEARKRPAIESTSYSYPHAPYPCSNAKKGSICVCTKVICVIIIR